ncbi:MAG TPA: hypothetical protein VIR01_11925, partial [Pyrinomonadaceae bacterium]
MVGGFLIRIIAVIISAVFVIASWITTGTPDTGFLRFFSIAVLVASIALTVWDKWVWKFGIAQRIPGVVRDVSGTWETQLESFWIDPATKERTPIKTVYIVIRQTSSRASVTLISNESKSKSSMARVIEEDGSWVLHYTYTNEPDVTVSHRSPIHHGSGVLSIVGNPAKRLAGSYWTDRET